MNVWGWHLWAQGCVCSAGGAGAGGVKGSCRGKLRWAKAQSMKLGQANSTGSQEKHQEARLLPAAVLGRTVGSVRAWAVLHAGVELKVHTSRAQPRWAERRCAWALDSERELPWKTVTAQDELGVKIEYTQADEGQQALVFKGTEGGGGIGRF